MVTVTELRKEAANQNIKGRSTMTKVELCAALKKKGIVFDDCEKGAKKKTSVKKSPTKKSPTKKSPKKKMTVVELKKLAKERGIKGYPKADYDYAKNKYRLGSFNFE